MNLIVAVDENWGIGFEGNLLFSIPEDMRFFQASTLNKVVVMGYNTFQSLPGSRPLKHRTNLVLSDDPDLELDSVIVCRSLPELFIALEAYPDEDVFVIGGQTVYEQLLDYCSTAYVTKVKSRRNSDRYFPNLDLLDNWNLDSQSEMRDHGGTGFSFCKYLNVKRGSI